MSDDLLWIFGYGSLVWRPDFPHRHRRSACIDGFARRFWQGSTDHRGVPERPGRVVTLLANDDPDLKQDRSFRPAPCWGTAYAIPKEDPDGILPGLDHRERGGYDRVDVTIWLERTGPKSTTAPSEKTSSVPAEFLNTSSREDLESTQGLVYVAQPDNENYLGPAPLDDLAVQVAQAHGPSGPNPEYVFELARSLRVMGRPDEHVFSLEHAVREQLAKGSAG